MSTSSPLRKLASTVGETLFWTAAQSIFEQTTGTTVHTAPGGLVTGPKAGLRIKPSQVGEMIVGVGAGVASVLTDPKNMIAPAPMTASSSMSSGFNARTNANSLFNHVGSGPGAISNFLPPKPAIPVMAFTEVLAQTGINLHGSAAPINYLAHNPIFQKALQVTKPTVLKDRATGEESTVLDGYVKSHLRMVEYAKDNSSLK